MVTCRKAYHAGTWYSENSNNLRTQIDALFGKIDLQKENIKAAICPHAGYAYALETNSHVYASINTENIKNIFVLGPNHHIYNQKCLFPQVDKYETPLGSLEINKQIISEIMSNVGNDLFGYIGEIDDEEEHSIEMQLPLIKYIMKDSDIKIIPIYVGCIGNDVKRISLFSNPLRRYFENKQNLFLFSSDFCHYGKRFGFTNILEKYHDNYIHKQIQNMDMDGANIISTHKVEDFIAYLNSSRNTICGSNPIKIMIHLLQNYSGKILTKLIHYSQSNAARNVNDSSVSYAGIVSLTN